eukprot:1262132-Prorocentrum_lima.AAC.1
MVAWLPPHSLVDPSSAAVSPSPQQPAPPRPAQMKISKELPSDCTPVASWGQVPSRPSHAS